MNTGDYTIDVQHLRRFERLPENKDGERREFFRGERITDVINGIELRAVGVDVIAIGVYPAEAGLYDPVSLIK